MTVKDDVRMMRSAARELWGDVPLTVEATCWDDGDRQVEAFHTFHSENNGATRGRVSLIWQRSKNKMTERVTTRKGYASARKVEYKEEDPL